MGVPEMSRILITFHHVVHKDFMYFLAVAFIKTCRHPGNDFRAPVIQEEKLSKVFIKGQSLDLALPDHIVKGLFQADLSDFFIL